MRTIPEIAELLKEVSDTPTLDARLFVEALQLHKETDSILDSYIERRLAHEPVSKILGNRGFWKSEFYVNQDVLDPRPDSETLISAVLETLLDKKASYRILDIGTGSGCLLFTLLDEYKNATGVGVDKSEKALEVAKRNQKGRVAQLYCKDFMIPNWTEGLDLFDLIISNPPYIPTKDIEMLSKDVKLYDPIMALDGGVDGLDAYRQIIKTAPSSLKENGFLIFEIGIDQESSVVDLAVQEGLTHIKTYKDFGRIPRVLVFQK